MATNSFLLYSRDKAPEGDSLRAGICMAKWLYKWTNRWSYWNWCYFV